MGPVPLIFSQFAGFVGQDAKRVLKKGGILLCNDSHGDATLAFCDDEFDVEKVRNTMKGPNYKTNADNYLFRKVTK